MCSVVCARGTLLNETSVGKVSNESSQRQFFEHYGTKIICWTSKIGPSNLRHTQSDREKQRQRLSKRILSMKYISILQNRQAKFVKGKRLSCTHKQQRAPIFIYTQHNVEIFFMARVCVMCLFFLHSLVRASKTDLIVRFILLCMRVCVVYVIFYCEDWANH